jgi:hypothetical protein
MGREPITDNKGWFLVDHSEGSKIILVEVTPENDIREHVVSQDCDCIPVMQHNMEGIPILIHNAFDGREDDRGN